MKKSKMRNIDNANLRIDGLNDLLDYMRRKQKFLESQLKRIESAAGNIAWNIEDHPRQLNKPAEYWLPTFEYLVDIAKEEFTP